MMRLKLAAVLVAATAFGPIAHAQDGDLVVYNPAGNAGELIIDAFRAIHRLLPGGLLRPKCDADLERVSHG